MWGRAAAPLPGHGAGLKITESGKNQVCVVLFLDLDNSELQPRLGCELGLPIRLPISSLVIKQL